MSMKEFEKVNEYMNKTEFLLEIVIIICLCVTASMICGNLIGIERMKRESLEGYRAFAIYETNSVGEVKIKRIEWKKP